MAFAIIFTNIDLLTNIDSASVSAIPTILKSFKFLIVKLLPSKSSSVFIPKLPAIPISDVTDCTTLLSTTISYSFSGILPFIKLSAVIVSIPTKYPLTIAGRVAV